MLHEVSARGARGEEVVDRCRAAATGGRGKARSSFPRSRSSWPSTSTRSSNGRVELFLTGFTLEHYASCAGEPAYFKALSEHARDQRLGHGHHAGARLPARVPDDRRRRRARARVLTVLVLVPFWTSVLVRTFAWMVILGRNGLVINLLLAGSGSWEGR